MSDQRSEKVSGGRFSRDSAFDMNLGGTEVGAIQKAMVLDGRLYVFSTNKVILVENADDVDPSREALDTRHTHRELYSVGTTSPYVARSIIQCERLLSSVFLQDNIEKQAILDLVWECTKLLLKAENASFRIYSDAMCLMPECDQIIEEHKRSTSIPALPQIEDLEERVLSFFASAKRCLERAHELLCVFYGAPNQGSNFQAYREWLTKHAPENEDLYSLLVSDSVWIKQIADARNALKEVHSKTRFDVTIENFRLQPGNRFSGPAWSFDLRDKDGLYQPQTSSIVDDMKTLLDNLLEFLEDLVLLCIRAKVGEGIPMVFYQLRPEEVNQDCPTKYSVSVSPDFLSDNR